MAFENVNKYREQVYRCTSCGRCARGPWDPGWMPTISLPDRQCPIYENHRYLAYSSQGMMLIIKGLLAGHLEPTDSLVKALYECLLCGGCNQVCAARPPFTLGELECADIFRALRADLVNMGVVPPKSVKKVTDLIQKSHNRFGTERKRDEWAKGMEIPSKGEIILFTGCAAAYQNSDVIQSLAKILQQSGVDFGLLEDEWCCGTPQIDAGLLEQFETTVKHNVDAIKRAGAKEIITVCGDGYRTIKFDYPKIVGDLRFKVLHSTELLSRLIDDKKIKFTKKIKLDGKVTYHDPCLLARFGGIYDEPRRIIESIPGIELVEMEGNKLATNCCGRPVVAEASPEVSAQAGLDRIRDAQAVGAKIIVTSCVNCKHSLTRAAKRLSAEIKVMDIVELVAQAVTKR